MTAGFFEFIDDGGCRWHFFPSLRDCGVGNTSSATDDRTEYIYKGLLHYYYVC